MKLEQFIDHLVCPSTRRPLEITTVHDGDLGERSKPMWRARRRTGGLDVEPTGATSRVLLVDGGHQAYPVIDEIPVLLAPEQLVDVDRVDEAEAIDLCDPRYAEAYEEMIHYNSVGEGRLGDGEDEAIARVMGALATHPDPRDAAADFPHPSTLWVDARHDSVSQLEAYEYLSPIAGKMFLQLGGSGSHAVKALLAGAEKALLLTPMLGEARFAQRLAGHFRVADRLGCVLGIGEEPPFADDSIDLAYSGGCFHHMRLEYVASTLHKILSAGGRFAAVDPWKTPLHTIGTRLIGKREASVFCRPITPERLRPLEGRFEDLVVTRHGPLLRYLFLGLEKARVRLPVPWMLGITRFDDTLAHLLGLGDRYGGSLLIAGTKDSRSG
jgi:uncharacterized protein YbaR (Trm112 family)